MMLLLRAHALVLSPRHFAAYSPFADAAIRAAYVDDNALSVC